jgi:hypothetical protein
MAREQPSDPSEPSRQRRPNNIYSSVRGEAAAVDGARKLNSFGGEK